MMRPFKRQASFKGVSFSIESHEQDLGRRIIQHEYPYQDQPYCEDLGLKPKEFQIHGFVSGRLCESLRDRLLQACEEEGAGELIHPYYGKKQVICKEVRISESALEMGIVYFTFHFLETGPCVETSLIPSFLKDQAAFKLLKTVSAWMVESYDSLENSSDFLLGLTDSLERNLLPVTQLGEFLKKSSLSFFEFKSQMGSLVKEPQKLVDATISLFSGVSKTVPLKASVSSLEQAFSSESTRQSVSQRKSPSGIHAPIHPPETSFAESSIPVLEPSGQILSSPISEEFLTPEQQEQQDVLLFFKLTCVCFLIQSEYFLEELEESSFKILLKILEESFLQTTSDEVFQGMKDLMSELFIFFHQTHRKKRVSISIQSSLPSLVLSYRLFGSLEKEQALLKWNQVSHPCFVGPGVIQYGS